MGETLYSRYGKTLWFSVWWDPLLGEHKAALYGNRRPDNIPNHCIRRFDSLSDSEQEAIEDAYTAETTPKTAEA